MNLTEITQRSTPIPWSEGDNIPWNDPDFSRRMLKEHLSQAHDAASRRTETIDGHTAFIHSLVPGGQAARVLDLGCGPGLYANRLARLGHSVYGIDFSPASIEYARETATRENLDCCFTLADLRIASFGEDASYDLVMLIFGEFNVFKPSDARLILQKAWAALKPGGRLLLETSTEASIRQIGEGHGSWSAQPCGLFSDQPHLLLEESFWDESQRAATSRYYVIDAQSGVVTRCASSYQAYSVDEYRALLLECGFCNVVIYPSLLGPGTVPSDFIALVAEKS